MHVYLPMTLTGLAAAAQAGVLAPAPIDGWTVTPGLRAELIGEDDEELEYAASVLAADAALARLVGDPSAPRRRVVVAVDVAASVVDDADGLATGAVVLREQVPFARVVSVLVDDQAAVDAVCAVLAAPDDADAAADLSDHQLLWFASQEIAELVAG